MAIVEGRGLALFDGEETRAEVGETDLATLVETYAGLLFRVAHSVLRNGAEAEDVVQDAFVRVLEHRRTLPEVRDLRVWLVRIAWNLALDRRRRTRPEQMDTEFARTLAAGSVPADQALGEARQLAAVLAAIERLPKAERHVLLLAAVEEMSTGRWPRCWARASPPHAHYCFAHVHGCASGWGRERDDERSGEVDRDDPERTANG